jgi:hypothetical protein
MSSDDVNCEEAPTGDRRDISSLLASWTLEDGTVTARRILGADGCEQIQLRIPMGLLQFCPDGRPDGTTPEGHESVLAWLRRLVQERHTLTGEHWYELDREITQYYHRRIALLAMAEAERREGSHRQAAVDYARVVRDADHNLDVMDFIRQHNPDEDFAETHEQYRGFVLGHRTIAAANYWLCRDEPEEALDAIQIGLDRLRRVYQDRGDSDALRRDPTAGRLVRLAEQIRKEHAIAKTLHEQLGEAVETEQFERAGQIRDRIRQRLATLKAPFKL